jgi:hypothetical protein
LPPGEGGKGHSWQGKGKQGHWSGEPQLRVGSSPWHTGRIRSLLTIDHHVVAQDAGCVEGPLPRALKSIPALQGGPHTSIHMEELSGVHTYRESTRGEAGQGLRAGRASLPPLGAWDLYDHLGLRSAMTRLMSLPN